MIVSFYGTTGELVKIAPVLARLRDADADLLTICTGQQTSHLLPLMDEIGLPQPDLWLGDARRDLESARQIPGWLWDVARGFRRVMGPLRARMRAAQPSAVLVHGDTFTTVLGALAGRLMRMPVAHVEAGMRSHRLLDPFPEELDRIVTAWLARLHFAPGPDAVRNLRRARGRVVDTHDNTVRDSLAMVPPSVAGHDALPETFGLVSIHRTELLNRPKELAALLELLRDHAARTPLLFVDHPVTAARIRDEGLGGLFDSERFVRIPKMSYFRFVATVKASAFVVTDSGGLQQECYYLDHPCLVHRRTTEWGAADGGCVVVSGLDLAVVDRFLADPTGRRGSAPDSVSPSDIIVRTLVEAGFAGPRAAARAD